MIIVVVTGLLLCYVGITQNKFTTLYKHRYFII